MDQRADESRGVGIFLLLMGIAMTAAQANAQMIVAHRGASHDAPENTLAAFKLAWQQGADGIEGDFHLTKDKRLICVHDYDMKRTARDPRKVVEMTFDEVRSLDAGSWKDKKYKGERAPSLTEVLRTTPKGKKVFIELKTGPEIVGPLKQELAEVDIAPEQIVIIAFNTKTIAECKRELPTLRRHWLTGFKKKNGNWTPTAKQVKETVASCGADGVGFNGKREVINADFLRTAGVGERHFWTIDKVDDAAYLRKLGAYGITTNRPGWLREQLRVARLPES